VREDEASDDEYEAWMALSVPPHAVEAYESFVADLNALLAHRVAKPSDQWVAYRGQQRLAFGLDDITLSRECLARFPDGRFCVYHIGRQPDPRDNTTVV
jgi:hypothetical protein